MKILLVDDDAFLRDMYAAKFKENNDEVAIAAFGNQALELVKKEPFDVVIIDMVMPGVSGVDLITALLEACTTCKCIVLSNQGETKDIEAAKQAGAIGYIIKADSIPSEVVQQVHKLCL